MGMDHVIFLNISRQALGLEKETKSKKTVVKRTKGLNDKEAQRLLECKRILKSCASQAKKTKNTETISACRTSMENLLVNKNLSPKDFCTKLQDLNIQIPDIIGCFESEKDQQIQMENEGVDECLPPQQEVSVCPPVEPDVSVCPPVEPELPEPCEPELPDFMKQIVDNELKNRQEKQGKRNKSKKPRGKKKKVAKQEDLDVLEQYKSFTTQCVTKAYVKSKDSNDKSTTQNAKNANQELADSKISVDEYVTRMTSIIGELPECSMDHALFLNIGKTALILEKQAKVKKASAKKPVVLPATEPELPSSPVIQMECEGVDECLPPQQPELSVCPPVEPELPGPCEPELPSFMKDIMDKELAIRKTKKDKKLKKKPKSTTKQSRISKKLSKSTSDNSDSKILYNYQEFHKECFRLCNQNRVEAYDRNMMKIAIQEFNEDDITSKEFVERITYVCGGLPTVPTGCDVYQMLDDGLALKR